MKLENLSFSEILKAIEEALWLHDIAIEEEREEPYNYSDEDFRACIKIFSNALIHKAYATKGLDGDKSVKLGNAIRELVLEYTDIDSTKLYKL